MTAQRLIDAAVIMLFVIALALALSASMQLDSNTDTTTQRDAQQRASAQQRLDHARFVMCGQAGWAEQPDGSTRCLKSPRNRSTLAQVQQ